MKRLPDVGTFVLLRDARLFVRRPELRTVLKDLSASTPLAPLQIFKPKVEMDHILRLGRLRLSEFIPDNREIARGVLQAGSCFLTRPTGPVQAGECSELSAILLMSLGEAEIWSLPSGTLEKYDVT